jgi:hypothetical protein
MPANPEFVSLITHTQTVARTIHNLYLAMHEAEDANPPDGNSQWDAAIAMGNAVTDLRAMVVKLEGHLGRGMVARANGGRPLLIPVVQGEPAAGQPALPVPVTFGDEMLDAPEAEAV